MNQASFTVSILAHSLAWALLFSVVQGLIVYCTLGIALAFLRPASARVKHYLSFTAILALAVWFADTWISQYQQLKGVVVYITQQGMEATQQPAITHAVTRTAGGIGIAKELLFRLEGYIPFILWCYAAGLALMLARFVVNILQLRALKTRGITMPDEQWNSLAAYWQKHLEIARPVRLYLSSRISVPMMLGMLKPVILLPVATINQLSMEQVEAILLHELAHIKRHDYLLNMVQVTVETVLFFNPFVWLISGIVRRQREDCCDEIVVRNTTNPLPYARALALLEDSRQGPGRLALAATGHNNHLLNRIKRIMFMKKNNLSSSQVAVIVAAAIAFVFVAAMFTFTPSFAQKAKGKDSDTTAHTKTVYKTKTIVVDDKGHKTVTEETSDKEGDEDTTNVAPGALDSLSLSFNIDADLNKMMANVTASTKSAMEAISSIKLADIELDLEGLQKGLKDIDWNAMKVEMQKRIEEVNRELKENAFDKELAEKVRRQLEECRQELIGAQKEMRQTHARSVIIAGNGNKNTDYDAMLKQMEEDGLIDRSKSYTIKKQGGELYINGNKQPESVMKKYEQYLKASSIAIAGSKGNLTISVNDEK